MPRPQRTVRKTGKISGVGLHSGVGTTLRIKPASAGAGVTFLRVDLPGNPSIRADASHLGVRARRTALVGAGDAEVHTVEHFLACCTGLGIDNLEVEIDGPECPGMDGSAAHFADLLESLEIVDQDQEREILVVERPVAATAGENQGLVALPGRSGLSVSYILDYGDGWLGRQHVSFDVTPALFKEEIAPARTFCLASEAEALKQAGLGQGATYENTLVVGEDGVVENEPHWPDEFARHKVLDLLGDIFLLEADIVGHVHAYRTGHAANLSLVRALRDGQGAQVRGRRSSPPPPPAMTHTQIRRILPHRYPFLLVDRVLEVEGFQRAVGIKNVTLNEPFFNGHYPDEPIMPGVLIVEAMAQLAGLLLLRKLELTGKVPVLLSIDRVKFRRAVVPGDQLRLEAETLRLSGSRGRVHCRSYVEGQRVAEARLNFALTDATQA